MYLSIIVSWSSIFFFTDTSTTEIYTLSLHDALPISAWCCHTRRGPGPGPGAARAPPSRPGPCRRDRKSTRLNSSHLGISYAVFCLKKKKKTKTLQNKNHKYIHREINPRRPVTLPQAT